MAASSKTIMDFLQPAKRLKLSSSSPSPTDPLNLLNKSLSAKSTSTDLTPDQVSRIELNKLRAKSKRNLKLCSQLVSNSKGSSGHVNLEELLVEDTWREVLPGELEKPYFKNLCKFVESEISNGIVAIYPPQHLIFNALNSTPFNTLKAVIIGQDPYHGPGQAMGLSFSVPQGVKAPSSLVNIFKELKQDLGCSIPSHGNLEKWAIQGVLLLNTVLTVRNHQANSHSKKGWEHFTDAVIKTISQKKEGVVFLLWGNSAQEKSKLIDQTKHHILKAAHPSGLSANRGFFGCRHFSRTNQLLAQMGISPIEWQL
ncbi:uracil-DNA glycosylase, mitochondrial [Populus nigra]|uniref:uracil-DNA glycosylase, mitochondrial n=1 Tax=Populus nigra TaxID=3691 RepID=UPI002B2648D8|nr:uracil-DNA glycosylase, mitochondrial [Populus nigra]